MADSGLSLLTFNIGNPSEERARRQLAWLARRDEHVLVLTETKASAGCQFLADRFGAAGYHVTFPVPGPGEYGVMIISRVQARPDPFGDTVGYLPTRAAAIMIPSASGPLQIIGAYVPSRDAGLEKTERKQKWLAACRAALAARDSGLPAVFLGDLNILEPGHQPHYAFFVPFEYDFYRALVAEHGFVDTYRQLHPDAVEQGEGFRPPAGVWYGRGGCPPAAAQELQVMSASNIASVAAAEPGMRLGARVLVLDPHDRVLLIHARDPDEPSSQWWELPGGGIDPGEAPQAAASRELAEETGFLADELGPCLWTRETRFRYRSREHHRHETVYLARVRDLAPALTPRHTPNEKAGLLGYHWWSQPELIRFRGRLLPPNLPQLLAALQSGELTRPLTLDV